MAVIQVKGALAKASAARRPMAPVAPSKMTLNGFSPSDSPDPYNGYDIPKARSRPIDV